MPYTIERQSDNTYDVANDEICVGHCRVLEDDVIVIANLTYTQCLTYVGARSVGKSHVTAKGFAMGYYV